jgi:hypothetical protein
MKQYSRRKQLLYSLILLVLAIVTVEAGLHLVYALSEHQVFPFTWHDDTIRLMANPQEAPQGDDQLGPGETRWENIIEVIHPYLGFVRDPDWSPDTSYLGFPQKSDDPLLQSSNSITIAVFGGSVAEEVSTVGESAMESTLRKHGINARILTIAMGGYKQPQQVLALAYLLTHSAAFDVVLNIDGFNEVALPQADNLPKKVDPFYPRAWYQRTVGLQDQVTLRLTGRLAALQDDRRWWATIFRDIPKFSIIRNLLWRAYDRVLERRIMGLNEQIRRSEPLRSNRFLTAGPDLQIDNETELYQQIAHHWKASSLLMKALCDANGITYMHILQPNQYFKTDRTLTQEERHTAFKEDHIYRVGVEKGYPQLVAAGSDLVERGVNFHDLTKIYDDVPQTIYRDTCCHPNKQGYEIVAEYAANRIAEAIRSGSIKKGRHTKIKRNPHRTGSSGGVGRRIEE